MDVCSSDPNLRCEYALRVALQTMKERCCVLQRRLSALEEENQTIRETNCDITPPISKPSGKVAVGAAENLQLRLQVAELSRQKIQLTEHINMVSNENRKLWSRLSQIAKDQVTKLDSSQVDTMCVTEEEASGIDSIVAIQRASGGNENQNLIRSKTFTKSSPNSILRHKLIPSKILTNNELILEEIKKNRNQENKVETEGHFKDVEDAELRFGFLKTDRSATGNNADFNTEAKICIEGLQELRREALKQQHDLYSALALLENRIALNTCLQCTQIAKPEMADKSLETDESVSDPQQMTNQKKGTSSYITSHSGRLNIIEDKIEADALDKTCPMCGKIYSDHVTFDAFREHVELHFVDDSNSNDIETSMERNFEFISHTVGDF